MESPTNLEKPSHEKTNVKNGELREEKEINYSIISIKQAFIPTFIILHCSSVLHCTKVLLDNL